jgi:hypothetical protein
MSLRELVVVVATGIVLAPSSLGAASAIVWNSETRYVRWVSGYQTAQIAEAWALDSCRKYRPAKASSCKVVVSCNEGGYGQLIEALGRDGRRMGVIGSCGNSSTGILNKSIRNKCEAVYSAARRCNTIGRWYDPVNDENVPDKCKNQHPSYDACYEWPYPNDFYF